MAQIPRYEFVSGDTASILRVTCTDTAGVVINLTGATAALRWKAESGVLVSRTMSAVGAPTAGVVEYQFADSELYSPKMLFEVQITDASSKIVKSNELLMVDVRASL